MLSDQLFATLCKSTMAYVKTRSDGAASVTYAIHAADGTFIWECASRDTAWATLRQFDIEPVSVH